MVSDELAEAAREETARADALEMFLEGVSPSACDRRCGLAPGTTHDEVVLMWEADRAAHERGDSG